MGGGVQVTFHLTVWVFLVLRLEQSWQKQRMLGEHHVEYREWDKLSAHGAFWKIQELQGRTEGL